MQSIRQAVFHRQPVDVQQYRSRFLLCYSVFVEIIVIHVQSVLCMLPHQENSVEVFTPVSGGWVKGE
ncbi:MAG: hypothetical protein IKM05_08555 [Clostridia bacterium]|nr:hypothetical protein [Clostridia bacterium]